MGFNKRISIGSSLRRKTEIAKDDSSPLITNSQTNDEDTSEKPDSTAIVPVSKPKDGEGKENDPKSSAHEAKKEVLAVALATNHIMSPEFSANDRAIFSQLA